MERVHVPTWVSAPSRIDRCCRNKTNMTKPGSRSELTGHRHRREARHAVRPAPPHALHPVRPRHAVRPRPPGSAAVSVVALLPPAMP